MPLIVDGNSFDDHKGSIKSLIMSMSASISIHVLIASWLLEAVLNFGMVVEITPAAKSCRLLRRLWDGVFTRMIGGDQRVGVPWQSW